MMTSHSIRTIINTVVEPNPSPGMPPIEVGIGKITRIRAEADPIVRYFDPPRPDLLGADIGSLTDFEIESLK